MRITSLPFEPVYCLQYKNVLPASQQKEGASIFEDKDWDILFGKAEGLPPGLDAIIFASDLQGHVLDEEELVLLGEKMPQDLVLLLELECPHIDPNRVGVVLCGDLFALTHKRGGHGDVREVWRAFKNCFAWVAGVAGNHDRIGENNQDLSTFKWEEQIYFLEKEMKKIDGMKVAGVSGVIGSNWKEFRWEEPDFLNAIKKCLSRKPDLFLLHEGPDFPRDGLEGTPSVRKTLERHPANLVCFGHQNWSEPLRELENGTQLLNLEGRTVILFP